MGTNKGQSRPDLVIPKVTVQCWVSARSAIRTLETLIKNKRILDRDLELCVELGDLANRTIEARESGYEKRNTM